MGDGGGAHAGLVGERRSAEADHQRADESAVDRIGGERLREDRRQGPGNARPVVEDDHERARHVHHAHEGHDLVGHVGNAPNPSDDHDTHQEHHHEPVGPRIGGENRHRLLHRVERLIHLEGIAAAERTADAQDGEHDGEHLAEPHPPQFAESLREVVHRAAHHPPIAPHVPVLLPQRALGELGGHAQQSGDDHPERRSRSTGGHGDRDAGDVPEPDRRRQRGGQRLKVAHLTRIRGVVVLPACDVDRVLERSEVDEAHLEGEVDRAEHEPEHRKGQHVRVVPEEDIEEEHGPHHRVHTSHDLVGASHEARLRPGRRLGLLLREREVGLRRVRRNRGCGGRLLRRQRCRRDGQRGDRGREGEHPGKSSESER